jgi:transcription antitermination factor NusG
MDPQVQDLKWHVVYTRPKSERKVAAKIADMGIESYLPMYKVVRQWSDRKKRLIVPLFPNYVFVKVNTLCRGYLFSIKELVRFVSIEQKPVVVRENEITTIQRILCEDVEVLPEEYFQEGMRVRIGQGQFAGLEGVIAKRCSKTRLIIKIDGLMKAFSINLSACHVEMLDMHHHAETVLIDQ